MASLVIIEHIGVRVQIFMVLETHCLSRHTSLNPSRRLTDPHSPVSWLAVSSSSEVAESSPLRSAVPDI